MPPTTSTDQEMIGSRYADSVDIPNVGPTRQNQVSIAKAVSGDNRSRAWRITLNRVNRQDRVAPLAPNDPGGSSPEWVASDFAYTAGFQNTPQIPPRRSNPIFSALNPGNGADIEPLWVQVAWGMNQGRINRMLANWPLQGASVVVEGSYVEVFGGAFVASLGAPPIPLGSYPNLAAAITPIDGLASQDAGELSINQRINLAALEGPQAQLLADGVGVGPPEGFTTALGSGSSIPTSAVYNVAPFSSYTARITALSPFSPRPVNVVVFMAATVPQFELRDNQVPNGAGVFVASPGNVGIVYRTDGVTGVKTVADLDALINTSTIVQVVPGTSVNPASKVFAGWTHVAARTPAAVGLGTGIIGAPTQGGAVYVPDFARRVRIAPATLDVRFAGLEYRVPFPGPEPLQINWYDDYGRVIDVDYQGIVRDPGGPTIATNMARDWLAVPAQAVMLAIYGAAADEVYDSAFIHWRVAP